MPHCPPQSTTAVYLLTSPLIIILFSHCTLTLLSSSFPRPPPAKHSPSARYLEPSASRRTSQPVHLLPPLTPPLHPDVPPSLAVILNPLLPLSSGRQPVLPFTPLSCAHCCWKGLLKRKSIICHKFDHRLQGWTLARKKKQKLAISSETQPNFLQGNII